MVDLIAISPCEGVLPLNIGATTLSEEPATILTSIAVFKGKGKALTSALKTAHGMAVPAPNRATGKTGARAIWFGHDMILLQGPQPDPQLAKHAALTDQSDAWAVVRIEGAGARDVLARLTPVDLRDKVFKHGHTARTELAHMMASITRTGVQSWQIMVFRGFAETLVHDLRRAMESVAARGEQQ